MTMRSYQLILIALAALANLYNAEPTNPPELSIKNKSFLLTANLRVTHYEGLSWRYQFEEAYSLRQDRAKISFKSLDEGGILKQRELADLPERGEFSVDKYGNVLLVGENEAGNRVCKLSNRATIERVSHWDAIRRDCDPGGLLSNGAMQISGAASALFLVDILRAKLQRYNEFALMVRNVPGVMYKYVQKDNQFQLYAFYAQTDTFKSSAIPMRITASFASGLTLEYEFIKCETFVDYRDIMDRIETIGDEAQSDVLYDRLAIERSIGCGANLLVGPAVGSNNEQDNPFEGKLENRFSFRAKVQHPQRGQVLSSVAYESRLNMMRVDERKTPAADETTYPSHMSSTLINFNMGHLYQVIDRQDDDGSVLSEMLDNSNRNDEQNAVEECILVKLQSKAEAPQHLYAVNSLLFGVGEQKFIYLGMARVRGIWTRVYEAHDTSWPTWIEQPVLMTRNWKHDNGKEERPQDAFERHTHLDALTSSKTILNTVIYLEYQHEDEVANLERFKENAGRVLLMEIYRIRSSDSAVLDKTVVQVNDFSWSLRSHSPDGSYRIEDYFTLGNRCPASATLESNHYAQVDMLLMNEDDAELARDQPSASFAPFEQEPINFRHLALLEALQKNLKLQPTIVYDIESRLKVRKKLVEGDEANTGDEQELAALEVSFRLARHRQLMTHLRYYGTGSPVKLYQFKLFHYRTSLSDCYHLAAHRRVATFFAHSSTSESCYIDHNADSQIILDKTNFTKPKRFELWTNGPMDVYHVNHLEDPELIKHDPISALASDHDWRQFSHRHLMKRFPLVLMSSIGKRKFDMYVKKFELQQLNEKESFQVDDDELGFMGDKNKFVGLGLIESDPGNKLVVSKTQGADSNLADSSDYYDMNSGTCETACLASAECKSYSICLHGTRFKCILSNATFVESKVLLQLLNIQTKRDTKFGQIFTIKLDDSSSGPTIRVKKQANCELHNKLYLDLFQKQTKAQHVLVSKQNISPLIYQVTSREDCARLCYEQTYRVFEQDTVADVRLKLNDLMNTTNLDDEHKELINSVVREHKSRAKGLCKEFFYLDQFVYSELAANLQRLIKDYSLRQDGQDYISDDAQNIDYCITGERKQEAPATDPNKPIEPFGPLDSPDPVLLFDLHAESHKFKFESLYEKHSGVKLIASKLTKDELNANLKIRFSLTFKEHKSVELMGNLLARHDNIQENVQMSHFDDSKCALICTLQVAGPWPACKSFDLIVVRTGDQISAYCKLNSITLKEAMEHGRHDLIDTSRPSSSIQMWHFEPKSGSVMEEMDIEGELNMAAAQLLEVRIMSRSDTAMTIIVILLGSLFGLLLGAKMGKNLLSTGDNIPSTTRDTENLVDDRINLHTMASAQI